MTSEFLLTCLRKNHHAFLTSFKSEGPGFKLTNVLKTIHVFVVNLL